MNWEKLTFGKYDRETIDKAVANKWWQIARRSMLGKSLKVKYKTLTEWLEVHSYSLESKIQVTNYVNALRRGGLVRPKNEK
jgi:hypothetical protein